MGQDATVEATAALPPVSPAEKKRRPLSGARRRRVPGGRPHMVVVRFTDEELAEVTARATAAGLTPTAFVAEAAMSAMAAAGGGLGVAAMGVVERRAWAGELMAVRRLLAATGNNLNQVARAANAGGDVADVVAMAVAASGGAVRRADAVLARLQGGGAR